MEDKINWDREDYWSQLLPPEGGSLYLRIQRKR